MCIVMCIACSSGWPKLSWFVAEHLPKVPRDWSPPPRPSPDATAYIEVSLLLTRVRV